MYSSSDYRFLNMILHLHISYIVLPINVTLSLHIALHNDARWKINSLLGKISNYKCFLIFKFRCLIYDHTRTGSYYSNASTGEQWVNI